MDNRHINSNLENKNEDDFIVIDVTEKKEIHYKKEVSETKHKTQNSFKDEDMELSLIDSAFSNVFEEARPWKNHFILQSHLFCEEELACCFDLAENFIKNKHSLALKLIVINRLEAYKNFNYEITAISKLTREILKNLDAQLNIDNPLNSFEQKFSQICFENIFYRDLKDFEFSALSRINISETQQMKIRHAVFSAMTLAENRYQESFSLIIDSEDSGTETHSEHKRKKRFEFIITETEKPELDFDTKFKLKCFENEFTAYIKNNAMLLNETELNSCEEISREFIRSATRNEYKNIFSLLNNKKSSGEHLSSIIYAVIEILSKLDCKLKNEKHLSQDFSKIAQKYMTTS